MPPRIKYDEIVYEKVVCSGKIFMYNSYLWDTLFPIVDIIRILKPNTVIGHVYGKKQQTIWTYGSQYNHRVCGYELKNKRDYLENLKAVKTIFIYTDSQDTIATNLINAANKNKINVVCYSNLDNIYHFYDNINDKQHKFTTAQSTLDCMYELMALEEVRKIADLFPDFEIIVPPESPKHSSLEECSRILREREKVNVKIFDPHLSKLKRVEYERANRNPVYPDSVETLNQKAFDKRKSLLSRFFGKK
jgi:hypothetical protein